MREVLWAAGVALGLCVVPAHADPNEFCAGFAEGWRSVRGEQAKLPACPAEPATPNGSTPFREGVKAGIRAARQR